jgi:hypothetical protein
MSRIQSVIFEKKKYNRKTAPEWLKKYNMKLLEGKDVDETKNFLRYRIRPPELFDYFRIKPIENKGIKLVIGFNNDENAQFVDYTK